MLGVDFMSENVRAILDEAGHHGVAVSHQLRGVGDTCLRRESVMAWSVTSVLAGHHCVAVSSSSGRASGFKPMSLLTTEQALACQVRAEGNMRAW